MSLELDELCAAISARTGKALNGWQRALVLIALKHNKPAEDILALFTIPDDWRANMDSAIRAGGVRSQVEWVEKFPGAHCWFDFKAIDSCAVCGLCRARDATKQKPCRGIARIELRSKP